MAAISGGAIRPVANAIIARIVPEEDRGKAFGILTSANAFGWALGPEFGYQAVYQCDDAPPTGGRSWQTCALLGPDGEVVVLHPLGGWQQWDGRVGD